MRITLFLLIVSLALLPYDHARADAGAADLQQLRTLVISGQFVPLTKSLERYQAQFEQDVRNEFALYDALKAFEVVTPEFHAGLDRWVKRMPKSWAPLIARSAYFMRAGWEAKGKAGANEQQVKKMKELHESARKDALAAVRLKPNLAAAYGIILRTDADFDEVDVLRKALKTSPASYVLRQYFMTRLLPRWGGTYELMERFAQRADAHVATNERLRGLRGFIYVDRADVALKAKEYDTALQMADKALSYGETVEFLDLLSKIYLEKNQPSQALKVLDRAIAIGGNRYESYTLRAEAYIRMGAFKEALEEMDRAEKRAGYTTNSIAGTKKWAGEYIAYFGTVVHKASPALAVEKYTQALAFDADNADLYCWRGGAYFRAGKHNEAIADTQKALTLDPRHADAARQLHVMYKTLKRYTDDIDLWSRVIRMDPQNADAYLARATANYYLKRMDAAVSDAARACDFGNQKGCNWIKEVSASSTRNMTEN